MLYLCPKKQKRTEMPLEAKYDYNRFGKKGKRVGQAVVDILSKEQPEQTVEETIDAFGPDFVKELESTIESNKHRYQSPFYVLILTKKEMWACNVVRNFFIARQTYPLATDIIKDYPNHTKTLYKVNTDKGSLEIMWCLPGHQECQAIARNPGSFDRELVNWIFQCYAGQFDL
jgi:hypothetical protein